MAGLLAWGCGGGDEVVAGSPASSAVPSPDQLADVMGDPHHAELLRDPGTEISRVEVGFLSDWMLLRVETSAGPHGQLLHFAYGDDTAWSVTQPEDFDAMVAADGTGVADGDVAEELVRTRLELTRPSGGLTEVVEDVDDLGFPGDLDPTEERRRDEVVDQLGDVVVPPVVDDRPTGGWTVTAFATTLPCGTGGDVELARHDLVVRQEGVVSHEIDVLAADIPGPICI
jgi:hypothetical protein